MSIATMHIPIGKKINNGAFRGPLNCPFCNHDLRKKSRWKFVDKVNEFRIRYRCIDCKRTVLYDITNNPREIQRLYGKQ